MDKETKYDIMEFSRGLLGAILLTILLCQGVSALYCGETYTLDTGLQTITNVTFTNNVTPLTYNTSSSNISIKIPQAPCPVNFSLTIWGYGEQYVEEKKCSSKSCTTETIIKYVQNNSSTVKPNINIINVTNTTTEVIPITEGEETPLWKYLGITLLILSGIGIIVVIIFKIMKGGTHGTTNENKSQENGDATNGGNNDVSIS